jgi:hypothetical protein
VLFFPEDREEIYLAGGGKYLWKSCSCTSSSFDVFKFADFDLPQFLLADDRDSRELCSFSNWRSQSVYYIGYIFAKSLIH